MRERRYNRKDFEDILKKNGYHLKRVKGDHFIWSNGKNHITINYYLNPMVALRLIKENNLVR